MTDKKNGWLLFVMSQPGKSTTPRIRLWRLLKGLGAAVLRDGVYLLPCRASLQQALKEQVQGVQTLGGAAYLLAVQPMSETDEHFQTLFDRSADYAALLDTLAQWRTMLTASPEAPARRLLQHIRREYEALVSIDYFPGPAQLQSAQALTEAEALVIRHFSPDEPLPLHPDIQTLDRRAYRGRRWATRQRIWVDRVASAWLIRRFIDPEAQFLWLPNPQACPPDAIGFDFDGAAFTHTARRVTFEVIVASFGLSTDAALTRLGMLVHALDVGGVPVPEAAGFAAILTGIQASGADDEHTLSAMIPVLDAFYVAFGQALS
ncbi:MAG: chromate resistance protein ChrB domain-containing protein [Candidatus Tectimicrobiota bacterium]